MRILGIDPGSRYTGYGIVEKHGNRLRHVASGRINATKGDAFMDRLEIIYDGLCSVLDEWKCEAAAIESIFTARNAMSSLKLGHARGVALLAAKKHAGVPVAEYAPAQVKLAVAGSGRARKDDVRMMVTRTLGITGQLSEDASDALAVAICHAHCLDFERRLTAEIP